MALEEPVAQKSSKKDKKTAYWVHFQ